MVNTPYNDESLINENQTSNDKVEKQKAITVDSVKDILTQNWENVILTDEQIQSIIDEKWNCDWLDKDDEIFQYDNVRIIANCLKNMDISKMRDFIRIKKAYVEKNRTISEEKYKELFWWSGKFWKAEINQREIWMCASYSWLELLKKTNWFDEMIQTNFKETKEWREVRLPFCDKNWTWIKVNKNEIDTKAPNIYWELKDINSKSKFLWFKILEIAFIKKFAFSGGTYRKRKAFEEEYKSKWDISLLNNKLLLGLEETWFNCAANIFLWDAILQQPREFWEKNLMDLAFNYHGKWLYKILLHSSIYAQKELKNPIIIYKKPDQLMWDEPQDIIIDENWNKSVKIIAGHIYSIEKCYIDKSTWEKRVRVVNPHHTWIKFDIPLEECKSVFEREILWIDIDKMFR